MKLLLSRCLVIVAALLVASDFAFADSQGSAVGGAAGNQSTGMGCIYQAPVLTTGQQATIACDATGRVKINGSSFTLIGQQVQLPVSSATALTPPAGATVALVVNEDNGTYDANVNCRLDGGNPTATAGSPILPAGSWWISGVALSNVKCIQQNSSAAIDVWYYQ